MNPTSGTKPWMTGKSRAWSSRSDRSAVSGQSNSTLAPNPSRQGNASSASGVKLFLLLLAVLSIFTIFAVLACRFSGSGLNLCSSLNDNIISTIGSAAIQVTLFSLAMFFLWKNDLRTTLSSIGFPGSLKTVVLYTIICLLAIFAALFTLGIISIALGFNDQHKVSEKVAELPIPVLLLAAVGAPVCEELFFRGFLTQRVGVILSSLIFGFVHILYGSTVEIVGAVLIGMILAVTFRMSKTITPCILAHMLYNTLAIIVMRLFT